MKLYKENKIGPMAGQLNIMFLSQEQLASTMYEYVMREMVGGYKLRPRNVHSTYFYVASVYLGCLRTSRTVEGGHEVRVKPYNATNDDTRRIVTEIAERLGCCSETAATFNCSDDPTHEEKLRLRAICNEWSQQICEEPLDFRDYPYYQGSVEEVLEMSGFINLEPGQMPTSFKFLANAGFSSTKSGGMHESHPGFGFWNSDGMYVMQMNRFGGGELLKRHQQWQNGISVDFFQRVFAWIGSPTGAIDKKFTIKIVEDVTAGIWTRQPYVINFPAPLAEERLSSD